MSEKSVIIRTQSSRVLYVITFMGMVLLPVLGPILSRIFVPTTEWDWFSFLAVFFGFPALVAAVAYVAGWYTKKRSCEYHAPDWEYKPVQMSIEDAGQLPRRYNREYRALVANSNYWMFFVPILIIMYLIGLPVYIYTVDPGLSSNVDLLFTGPLLVLFFVSLLSGYLATSNAASEDFTLPLVREAVKLAHKQTKVPGATHVYIVMDKAEHEGFKIYSDPRVLLRVSGLEDKGYVESWSGEIGSVWRMLCRLYESEGHPQVVWWWVAHDRTFRKYVFPDESGYYVKFPVRSMTSEPGVKDVELLTKNAVAILVREEIHRSKSSEALESLMDELNAKVD